jgi:hypothetical protein
MKGPLDLLVYFWLLLVQASKYLGMIAGLIMFSIGVVAMTHYPEYDSEIRDYFQDKQGGALAMVIIGFVIFMWSYATFQIKEAFALKRRRGYC